MKRSIRFIVFCLLAQVGQSQVVKTETLAAGLLYPVGIYNSGLQGDNRLFVLEKRGRIKIVDRFTGAVNPVPFLDIYSRVYPVTSQGDERGLLGLAFHPDYANNGYFYINYVNQSNKTIIARYQVSPFADTAFKYSEQILMTVYQPYSNHKGGSLVFGPDDGFLYIGLGDGGSSGDPANRAQNVDSLLGKTLRVDVSNINSPYYFPAPGNPFTGTVQGRDEIFDWGLRNPWRSTFDRLKHDFWTGDVGQNAFEEINFRSKCDHQGYNYGWRCYEGTASYNTSGCQALSAYEAPVAVYGHSLGCSVTPGYVYRGAREAGLFGKYLFTDYCQGRIWATWPLSTGGFTTALLPQVTAQINNNLCSFGEDIDGELYMAAIGSGRIYRLLDTVCAPTAYIDARDTVYTCGSTLTLSAIKGSGLTYTWTVSSNGTWSTSSLSAPGVLQLTPTTDSIARVWLTASNGTCTSKSNEVVVIPGIGIKPFLPKICDFESPVALEGHPPIGIFSGPGVTGSVFNPTVGLGTFTITYTKADTVSTCYQKASGCVLQKTEIIVVLKCFDGIAEQHLLESATMYPNPASDMLTMDFATVPQKALNITITDLAGKVVLHENIVTLQKAHSLSLSVPDGFYLIVLKSGVSAVTKKLIVAH